MILYSDPISPNCAKVAAVLHHLDLPYELRPVRIIARETRTPEYLKVNPNGLVPTLVDGDLVLWESNAIILHLIVKAGSDLLPQDPVGRAQTMQWLFWQASHWGQALGTIGFERLAPRAIPGFTTDLAAVQRAERELEQYATVLEAHLQGRDYVLGQTLTVADIALVASASKREPAAIDLSRYPNITSYLQRVESQVFARQTAEAR